MSPSFSYQRHTPGRVPFQETFSWQSPCCLTTIRALSRECSRIDGCRNLDDGPLLSVLDGSAMAWLEPAGRAYVQRSANQVQLLVHPECRGQGWGSWLLQAALEGVTGPVEIWAYGDDPRAVAWLEGHGFRSHRVLYSLQRQGPPLEMPCWPEGWRIQSYADEHLAAWHEVHVRLQRDPRRAWTQSRLQRQLLQPETPAQRFWLLWQGEDLRGYVWLKGEEIFLLALDPACRGAGLGRRLLQFALAQCENGWGYCDDHRPEALGLYRQMGLVEIGRDRCLRLST